MLVANILLVILIIMLVAWTSGIIYLITKGHIFKWFYHDILKWHLPNDKSQKFDGCSFHTHCKICGEEIMQDSQGNWY